MKKDSFGLSLLVTLSHSSNTYSTQPSISLEAETAERESTCLHFYEGLEQERILIPTGGHGTNPQRILRDDRNVSSPVLSSYKVMLHFVFRTTLTQTPLHVFIYRSKK